MGKITISSNVIGWKKNTNSLAKLLLESSISQSRQLATSSLLHFNCCQSFRARFNNTRTLKFKSFNRHIRFELPSVKFPEAS